MIKILSIGQLPKEVGGSYTSGIARVVYELSKQSVLVLKLICMPQTFQKIKLMVFVLILTNILDM